MGVRYSSPGHVFTWASHIQCKSPGTAPSWVLLILFCLPIINIIPQDHCRDGVVVLWAICNNIHRNNAAFIETIKGKVRDFTLTFFSDDVSQYIMHIWENLTLIASTNDTITAEHNDLIFHLFHQQSQHHYQFQNGNNDSHHHFEPCKQSLNPAHSQWYHTLQLSLLDYLDDYLLIYESFANKYLLKHPTPTLEWARGTFTFWCQYYHHFITSNKWSSTYFMS